MVVRSVAPVANTITSTTSATQDLEVFKNYPSEKNNKLIQKKYGSEDEFFKKVAEEGYKQGFESVPKPSFDPNLPATDISNETLKRFIDPQGTEVYKGTPLEQYAGTGDLTRNIPTMQSTFPEGQAIPIEAFDKWPTMDKSGVTELGKSWSQAGGEFPTPTSYPSMSMEEDRIRQAKEAQLYGINNIGRSTPSTGAPTYTGEGSALPTVSESKKMTKLDDGMMYSDAELRNMGFSEEQIGRGVQPTEQPDHDKRRQEQSQLYGIDTRGIKSIETKDTDTKKKEIWEQDEPHWKKRKAKLLDKIQNIYNPSRKTKMKKAELMDLGDPDAALSWEAHKAMDKPTMPMKEIDEFLEILKRENPDISGSDLQNLAQEHGITWWDLSKHGIWKGKELVKEGIKRSSERKEATGVSGLFSGDEVKKREEIMKKAEMMDAGDPDAGIKALEQYISGLKKDDDDSLEVTVPIGDKIFKEGSGRATDTGGLLEVTRRKMDQLMKDVEKNKLPKEDIEEVTTNLENQGVETKGLTDKNMLLIAMGLGMMASDKPGLQGVGAGALTGLKTVAPLLTKKASDFQIVEVADPKNPGQTKLVKINKRTNETTDLGLGGKGTEIASIKLLKYRADKLKIDVDDLIRFDLLKSNKTRSERIESMTSKVLSNNLLAGLEMNEEMRQQIVKEATAIIDLIDESSKADLDKLLKV